MPSRHHIRPRTVSIIALLIACGGMAYAANVSTQARPDYQRVVFDFGGPARMQVAQGTGSVTLTFSKPITGTIEAVRTRLQPYVTGATLSADKTAITLNMNQQYRVRQFISGDTVGIDILTGSVTTPPAPAEKAPPAPVPVTKPVAAAAKPVPAKPAPKPAAVIAPPEPLATTAPEPKPAPAPAPKVPEAVVATVEAPQAIRTDPSPMLSTKPLATEPAPAVTQNAPELTEAQMAEAAQTSPTVDPLLTTKKPTPEPEPIAPPVAIAPVAAPSAQPAPPAISEEIEPEQAAAENALPDTEPHKPFLITTKKTNQGTAIHFPWAERTAAAVFERGRDIWIVFSRERAADTKLLASVLPKEVVRVQQYKLAGATVLRLTTDGTLHAATRQPQGAYEWEVTLAEAQPRASLDIPIAAETEEKRRQLLLQVYDVSAPLQFYDPTLNDRLVVVPTYEAGRGVATLKHFPELDILPTQQGIAVASLRDDLHVRSGRTGVKLLGDSSLSVSDNLPIYSADARPVPGAAATADVMMPYSQWYVPADEFTKQRAIRLKAIASATPAQAADSLMRMVELYLGQGLAAEADGYLSLLKAQHPDDYAERKLALLSAATDVMLNRLPEAKADIAAPELDALEEAAMWRELIAVLTPRTSSAVERLQRESEAETEARRAAAANAAVEETGEVPTAPEVAAPPPAPVVFDFLRYHPRFIRFYPPRVRQFMALAAADAYSRNGQEEEALKVFDTLNRDGILTPVQGHAEFTLGTVAEKKGKTAEALKLFDRLSTQYADPYVQAKARYAAIMLRYKTAEADAATTANALESLRLGWRGDRLQRDVLMSLAAIYKDNKRYDDTLRTWKYMIESFPQDGDVLTLSGDMSELFEELFLNGMADDMTPLKSLALFYEFRDLTPIGDKGNQIIQQLADRLAAVDLLDRATQLLDNQVKFRLSGEDRARVGARLALLYLLNKQPAEALNVLEVTNYGEAARELRRQRIQLTAQALSDLGKHEEALSMLFSDDSKEADTLRLDILWTMKDWPNVINQAEDILSARPNLTSALTPHETEVLMKLALGYSFEGDSTQLRYLRDYYTGLLPETQYKEIFSFLTNDTTPLDPEDFQLVAEQISRTEGFLDTFRKQIAAGNLSETVK